MVILNNYSIQASPYIKDISSKMIFRGFPFVISFPLIFSTSIDLLAWRLLKNYWSDSSEAQYLTNYEYELLKKTRYVRNTPLFANSLQFHDLKNLHSYISYVYVQDDLHSEVDCISLPI